MAIKLITDTILTAIANAIRAKTGKSDSMTPAEMATEIASIPSGGGGFDWSTVKGISFYGNKLTANTDLSTIDTSGFTDMSNMFYNTTLASIDVSSLDTSNVTKMDGMFSLCNAIQTLDVSTFNTSKVTTFNAMFSFCSNLTSIDLSAFDTSRATTISYMFNQCSKLTSVNLSSFDTTHLSATGMNSCFNNCSRLTDIIWSQKSTVQPLVTAPATAGITETMNFYVPDNLVTSYQEATNWSTIASQIHGISDCPAAVKALYNIS